MTIIEAYKKVKIEKPNKVLLRCLEFKDFYGFLFVPPDFVGQKFGGSCYTTVSKSDGSLSFFSPTMDLKKYKEATRIDVSIFEHI